MKEFMFYIRNANDTSSGADVKNLTDRQHLEFVKKCEVYIADLQTRNQLVAAQPLVREGILLSKKGDEWEKKDLSAGREIQVGYYHILAETLEEAIEVAKRNPEFEYVPSASIEIRPIKTKEKETGFVYPKGQ